MSITEAEALKFVTAADFSGLPDYQSPFDVLGRPSFTPDAGEDQSAIVGSSITTFAKGVTDARRQMINDSLLFAQLVANKRAPDPAPMIQWYNVYFDALTNVGWVLQNKSFSPYEATVKDADVSEAVLLIASGLVGGVGTIAYQLIKSTLDAMRKLANDSPWITLFRRETQHERASRFQFTLVDQDTGQHPIISLMTFDLEATQTQTQVLFSKYTSWDISFKQASGAVTINDKALTHIAPEITKKIEAFCGGYVMSVDLGSPKPS